MDAPKSVELIIDENKESLVAFNLITSFTCGCTIQHAGTNDTLGLGSNFYTCISMNLWLQGIGIKQSK